MLYLVSDVTHPLIYLSCGNLISQDAFLHSERLLDSHVLIHVKKGTLHIHSNGNNYDISSGQFVLLFAGKRHYGYKPSNGALTYDWCHFQLRDPGSRYYHCSELKKDFTIWNTSPQQSHFATQYYIFPEYGSLPADSRSALLFTQLADTAKRENYIGSYRCHYLLSTLALELCTEALSSLHLSVDEFPPALLQVIDWIRLYYDTPLSVEGLALQFGYNPVYLSGLFKKYTGYPLTSYISRTRIAISKNLLTSDMTMKIRTIGKVCGFQDEKTFLKVFKKIEGITPGHYRKAYCQKFVNRE